MSMVDRGRADNARRHLRARVCLRRARVVGGGGGGGGGVGRCRMRMRVRRVRAGGPAQNITFLMGLCPKNKNNEKNHIYEIKGEV